MLKRDIASLPRTSLLCQKAQAYTEQNWKAKLVQPLQLEQFVVLFARNTFV